MACGCNKNKGRSGAILRPTTTARSSSGGIAAGPTPTQIRAQAAAPSQQQTNSAGLSAERRKTQALRRDAIRRSLNK
jgi:hypothetical protein